MILSFEGLGIVAILVATVAGVLAAGGWALLREYLDWAPPLPHPQPRSSDGSELAVNILVLAAHTNLDTQTHATQAEAPWGRIETGETADNADC